MIYKLVIRKQTTLPKKRVHIDRIVFEFENKEDALSARLALEKAKVDSRTIKIIGEEVL